MEMAWGKEDEGRKGESKGGGEGTPPLSPSSTQRGWDRPPAERKDTRPIGLHLDHGVHIRHADKLSWEAKLHEVDEYFQHVER